MDSISIRKLSKQALKKLEKGLPVRVKAGDGHTLELGADKVKKLKRADETLKRKNSDDEEIIEAEANISTKKRRKY